MEMENKLNLVVSTLEDENDGDFNTGDLSLREAIATAEAGNTITFDSELSGGTIGLVLGELTIDKDLTITGLGANNLTIDEQSLQTELPDSVENRVFKIDDGDDNTTANVTITGVTITGGNPDGTASGGGILNRENLTLNSSVVDDNFTKNAAGGGIRNEGELTLNNSVVSNNSAGFRNIAGGILNLGTANIINSTIANNGSFAPGGGIASSGTLNITNSTVTDNGTNFDGDGINVSDGTATVTSSIIAGNGDSDLQGDFISGGNNLIGNISDATGFIDGVNNDIIGTADLTIEPRLNQLQDNGGATPTVALLDTSPAIDAGSNPNDLTTDQRGVGFDRTVGEGTDIGAFELQDGEEIPENLIVSTLKDENDGDFNEGDLSLREAIATAEAGATITFDSSLTDDTMSLSLGELLIDKALSINGLGANNLTIDAGEGFGRVFNIDDGDDETSLDVAIDGLTITGGNIFSGGPGDVGGVGDRQGNVGGGIKNSENLSFSNSVVTGNSANQAGGGIYNSGTLSISSSAVTNNDAFSSRAGGNGGGIFNVGTLSVGNSTISGNGSFVTGGISSNEGSTTIDNSTISNNTSTVSVGGIDGSATITSSIIAGNLMVGSDNPTQSDLRGEFISGGNNLIGNPNDSIGFVDGENGDLVGTADNPIEPLLGILQDNAGSTPTVALLEGSPAIDAGSNPNKLATDQRGKGFDRTVGNATDIGAFEVQDVDEGDGGLTPPDPALLGDDVINGTNADDVLLGGEGNNILYGFDGNDRLETGSGNDTLDANKGDDTLIGGDGNNILYGFDGLDILETGSGNDTLDAGNGDDMIDAGGGNDIITAGSGNDSINAGNGSDTIDGGSDADTIDAGAGDDLVNGNIGNDTLTGAAGNDTLVAGAGDDFVTGNGGSDLFVLDAQGGANTIQDFDPSLDSIGLADDITFGDLSITGSSDAAIAFEGETIGIIANISATDLSADNFVTYEI